MTFKYMTTTMQVGECLQITEVDILAWTNLASDGRGGFHVIVHVLQRQLGEIESPLTKELPN